MMISTTIRYAIAAVTLAVIPTMLHAFSSGPLPGLTGAPGEGNCSQCHGGSLTQNSASLLLDAGGQLSYTPGGPKQTWTLNITDNLGVVFGFELSVRQAADTAVAAGNLEPAGTGMRVICSNGAAKTANQPCAGNGPQYIEHTLSSANGVWSMEWTPPSTNVGDITVYVAGNAANGNGNSFGDRIHLKSFTLAPAAGGPAPAIFARGVVDVWSFTELVSDGMFVSIFGTNLASTTLNWDGAIVNGQSPTTLSGVSVKINNRDAFINYVSPGQVNVLVPSDGAEGMVPVNLTTENGTSNTAMVQKRPIAPAIFAWPHGTATEGNKYVGAAFPPNPDGITFVGKPGLLAPVNIPTRPARPDEFVLIFVTGCGPTNPALPDGQVVGQAVRLASEVEVKIGDVKAEVFDNTGFLIYAGECQFNVKIPASTPDGDHKVEVDIAGNSSPNDNTFITVQRQ